MTRAISFGALIQATQARSIDPIDTEIDTYVPITIPDRLAINSESLLSALGQCIGENFTLDRNVWVRPFKYLVAFGTEIRTFLQKAELACDQAETNSGLSTQKGTIEHPSWTHNPEH